MTGFRLVGRGLHDTFENLAYFVLASLLWWLAQATIIFGPPATIALFRHADPRIGTGIDRLSFTETITLMRTRFITAWKLFLIAAPVMALVFYNLGYYSSTESAIGAITPFWIALLCVCFVVNGTAFAVTAIAEKPAWPSFKSAFVLVGYGLPTMLVIILLLAVIIPIGLFLVIPALMFLPPMVAAIFNRFVLASMQVDIPDPLTPTAERAAENSTKRRRFFG